MRQAFYTRDYGPPFSGGWRDWPAGYIARMRAVVSYYQAAQAWKQNSHDAAWQIKNGDISEDITFIEKLNKGEITGNLFIGDIRVHRFINGKYYRNRNQG